MENEDKDLKNTEAAGNNAADEKKTTKKTTHKKDKSAVEKEVETLRKENEEVLKNAADLQKKNKELEAKATEVQDRYMRLMAEYDNFRKRSQKEKDNLFTEAKADALKSMFPVYDNVERAVNQPTTDEAYAEGVKMIMKQLEDSFTKLGITKIGEVGETFDPNKHNAVMHVDDESLGENVVAQVFQKGFMIGDKVVRFAMVQVAN